MLDEIGLFHRIVVILDSRQEGENELDFTMDGLRNQGSFLRMEKFIHRSCRRGLCGHSYTHID